LGDEWSGLLKREDKKREKKGVGGWNREEERSFQGTGG